MLWEKKIRPSGCLLCSNLIGYTFATSNHLPQKNMWDRKQNSTLKRNHSYQKRSYDLQIRIFSHHRTWKNTLPALKKIGIFFGMISPYIPWETSDPRPHCAFSAKGSQAELHKDQGNSEVPSLPHLKRGRKTTNKKQILFSNISNAQYTFCLHSGSFFRPSYVLTTCTTAKCRFEESCLSGIRSQRLLVPTVMYYHFFGSRDLKLNLPLPLLVGGKASQTMTMTIRQPPLSAQSKWDPSPNYINKQKYLLGEFGESCYNISPEEFQKNQPSLGG